MPSSDSTPPLRTSPISIVVADDVVEIQQLLGQWLRDLGCIVTCVSTGQEAVRVLRMAHVDMVITDILMPDGDGLELITELKRTQPSIRIIAMSGGGNHLRAEDCLKFANGLGAHGVLLKPFKRDQFLEVVTQHLCAGERASKSGTGDNIRLVGRDRWARRNTNFPC
jgi:CheY-like chemotaxis protein